MIGSAPVLESGTEIDRVWGIYGKKWVENDLKGQKHAKIIKYNMWAYIWVVLLGCGGLFHIFDIFSIGTTKISRLDILNIKCIL